MNHITIFVAVPCFLFGICVIVMSAIGFALDHLRDVTERKYLDRYAIEELANEIAESKMQRKRRR